jgi:hypothetical protein
LRFGRLDVEHQARHRPHPHRLSRRERDRRSRLPTLTAFLYGANPVLKQMTPINAPVTVVNIKEYRIAISS